MAKKVLMICLGNICRSPLAEGILKSKVGDETIVDSAGTAAYHEGEKPDTRSIEIAKINNIDISTQRARKVSLKDLDEYDLIYTMDKSNYNNLMQLAKTDMQRSKIKMIMEEVFPGEEIDVPDPYYGGKEGFANVYNMLDRATDIITDKHSL